MGSIEQPFSSSPNLVTDVKTSIMVSPPANKFCWFIIVSVFKVPYIALTKEEKEFLKSAHMDVQQEEEDFESDVEDGSLETTLIADPGMFQI